MARPTYYVLRSKQCPIELKYPNILECKHDTILVFCKSSYVHVENRWIGYGSDGRLVVRTQKRDVTGMLNMSQNSNVKP